MHMGIAKIMKIIEIKCTNYENPQDLKTHLENYENNKKIRNPYENHENHENHRNPLENNENQENLRNPCRIMTISKIIEIK